jgi:hypothetical protein
LKIHHTALIIQTKLAQDFIQASIVHYETWLQHCIYYSNTKGVTPSHAYIYTPIQEKKELARTIFELGQLSSPFFGIILRNNYLNKRYYQVYEVTEEP